MIDHMQSTVGTPAINQLKWRWGVWFHHIIVIWTSWEQKVGRLLSISTPIVVLCQIKDIQIPSFFGLSSCISPLKWTSNIPSLVDSLWGKDVTCLISFQANRFSRFRYLFWGFHESPPLQVVDAAGLLLAAWVGTCGDQSDFQQKNVGNLWRIQVLSVSQVQEIAIFAYFFCFGMSQFFKLEARNSLQRPLPFIQRPTKVWYQMFVAALAVSLPFQLGAEKDVSDGWGAGDPALGKTWERNL